MKFKSFTLMAIAMLCMNLSIFSQQRNCSAMENLDYQKQQDDKVQYTMDNIEKQTRAFASDRNRSVEGIITIPVVVHVIYSNSNQNISEAQILSQIQVLNEDFRRTNADADGTWSQAADSQIEFCMASVDPNGNPTTGITRKSSSTTNWGSKDAMKYSNSGGVNAWPTGDYLNMWVCNIGEGKLGYAQFPGGGAAATDGVVISPQYFGNTGYVSSPFDLGRTTTHEVGHWLNLRHIWGDGNCYADDFVSDTPTSDAANYGCVIGHVSCNSTDMVQNYMDYSNDACMNLYTNNQKVRMRALFDTGGFRASLLNSGGCGNATPTPTCSDGIQNGNETGVDCGGSCVPCQTACTQTEINISITFDNYPEETSWSIVNASGATVASGGTYANQADGSTLNLAACLADGCYDFIIADAYGDGICCSHGNGSYTVSGAGTVLASGASFTNSASTNFCIDNTPAPSCSDGIQNGNETGVDCGGSCAPCNTECVEAASNFQNFESGWGIWNDGGTDCYRVNYAPYAASGSYAIRLRDNSGIGSSMTTDNLGLDGFEKVTIEFSYYPVGMETGEDFWLQGSLDGGSTWQTVSTWVSGTDFSNNAPYSESVSITGTFNNTTKWRFRCDASANDDRIYMDDVKIIGCANGSRTAESTITIAAASMAEAARVESILTESSPIISELNIYPNPTRDILNIKFDVKEMSEVSLKVMDSYGRIVDFDQLNLDRGQQQTQIDVTNLSAGFYFVVLQTGTEKVTKRFIRIK